MKKLLFIMDTFPLGGIAKSLLSLFHELGDRYEIDFLLMKREGLFLQLIPDNVHLLEEPIEEAFRNPHPKNIFYAFRSLSVSRFMKWCAYSTSCTLARITGGLPKMVCVMDSQIAKLAKPQAKHYDAAIAYQGGRCIYYNAAGIDADIKIGYVHSDYSASWVDYMMKEADEIYFPKMDYLVTISPKCLASLHNEFPSLSQKELVIENICSPKLIQAMACSEESFNDGFNGIRLVTMARFDIKTKGIDYAIEACAILKKDGIPFRWYFLGDGAQRNQVVKLIKNYHVENEFVLLGSKTNPYPFIKDADIYVQPSRFEGKSVALDEVKALQKPVVVTNFSTVCDQFADGQTALIAQMNPEDIADKIKMLIFNKKMRDMLSSNLSKEKVGNEEQVKVFENLLTSRDS